MLEDSIYEIIRGFIVAKTHLDCGAFMGELPLRDIGLYRRKHFKGAFVRVEEFADGYPEGTCRRYYGQRGLLLEERQYFRRRVFRDTKQGLIVGERIDEYRSAFYHYDKEGKLVHVERRYFNFILGWIDRHSREAWDSGTNKEEAPRPVAERILFDLRWDSQGRLVRVAGARFLYLIRYLGNGNAAELDIHTTQFSGHERQQRIRKWLVSAGSGAEKLYISLVALHGLDAVRLVGGEERGIRDCPTSIASAVGMRLRPNLDDFREKKVNVLKDGNGNVVRRRSRDSNTVFRYRYYDAAQLKQAMHFQKPRKKTFIDAPRDSDESWFDAYSQFF